MTHPTVAQALKALANAKIAEHSSRFFKSGPGEYAEGDEFLGVRVPEQRKIARKFVKLPQQEVLKLLKSKYHEERLTALLIWTYQYPKADDSLKSQIYEAYMANTQFINNWDLVDASAHKIVGPYLENRDKAILYTFAHSEDLWQRRIAIISTYYNIHREQFELTLDFSQILLNDPHDLIHKAVGWMLRELGKKDQPLEESFLKKHYQTMPRTMLRYAIEKFPESLRKQYLNGTI